MGYQPSKPVPQFLTPSTKAVPPKCSPPPSARDQVFKCMSQWGGHFSLKPQQRGNSTIRKSFEKVEKIIISIFKITPKAHYFL